MTATSTNGEAGAYAPATSDDAGAYAPTTRDGPAAYVPAAVDHLTPGAWQRATRRLLAKALGEFAHERLLEPVRLGPAPAAPDGPARYEVTSDDGRTAHRFTARRLALDHWQVDPASLTRHTPSGEEAEPDALAFFTGLRSTLGLSDDILPVYLEEITATLSATAFRGRPREPRARTAAELPTTGFQAVEAAMTEGHPCFVANSGRLGFGSCDHRRYTPEAAAPVRLFWLAAHRDHAVFSAGEGVAERDFMAAELGTVQYARLRGTLAARGLDPAAYVLLPAHPWQWEHKLSVTFAGEVAAGRLVPLGPGDDGYLAQQSVRTFFNASHPERHYVKTALSVLNMGFMRGLSAAYMAGTPAINDWLAGLIAADPTLKAARFSIIRERAAVGYHHRGYEAATAHGSPYRMMLAALWRESPVAGLAPGETPVTMAALLHTDDHTDADAHAHTHPHADADARADDHTGNSSDGSNSADGSVCSAGSYSPGGPDAPDRGTDSFAAALIARSGLPPARWLRRYLDAYLVPVLHSLYAYGLAYMPHGENVILVLGADGGTVERAVFKDIAEEIMVMDPDLPLPPAAERIRAADVPDEERVLAVFTDVFDCFLRFLSAILHTRGVLDEDAFWRTVAECVADYQQAHPHLADRFARHDLFADSFALSCLNRLQLRNNRRMVDLADPSAALQFAGTLTNPLAPHRPHRTDRETI
ncbi:IucA/IucC family protein [Streptomyces sp. NRRL F-5123]|uniref:IucA/IucC family protein n=1 Tax=Streptomyces sp. NRRL F-5123 TaxID=1463856 RepID=UPI0007C58F63|nr:IucA/IucC family siderophore biosynthesis protein [Streptomyces sp. NRRL F-5123]